MGKERNDSICDSRMSYHQTSQTISGTDEETMDTQEKLSDPKKIQNNNLKTKKDRIFEAVSHSTSVKTEATIQSQEIKVSQTPRTLQIESDVRKCKRPEISNLDHNSSRRGSRSDSGSNQDFDNSFTSGRYAREPNFTVRTQRVRDININRYRTNRCGIIIKTMGSDGKTYYCFGVDRPSKEMTDFGGTLEARDNHNIISCAVREFNEESLKVFGTLKEEDVLDDISLTGYEMMIIIHEMRGIDPIQSVKKYDELARVQRIELRKLENSAIRLISETDLKNILVGTPSGKIYDAVHLFLQRSRYFVTDFKVSQPMMKLSYMPMVSKRRISPRSLNDDLNHIVVSTLSNDWEKESVESDCEHVHEDKGKKSDRGQRSASDPISSGISISRKTTPDLNHGQNRVPLSIPASDFLLLSSTETIPVQSSLRKEISDLMPESLSQTSSTTSLGSQMHSPLASPPDSPTMHPDILPSGHHVDCGMDTVSDSDFELDDNLQTSSSSSSSSNDHQDMKTRDLPHPAQNQYRKYPYHKNLSPGDYRQKEYRGEYRGEHRSEHGGAHHRRFSHFDSDPRREFPKAFHRRPHSNKTTPTKSWPRKESPSKTSTPVKSQIWGRFSLPDEVDESGND